MHLRSKVPCFVVIFLISHKWYSIGKVLKRIFCQNPGIAKVLVVERDVIFQNLNFAKVDRKRGRLIRRGCLYS